MKMHHPAGFLIASLVAAMAGTARGESLTYQATIGGTGTDAIPYAQPFDLPQFNPGLGTLTDIDMTMKLNGSAELDALNLTRAAATFTDGSASISIVGNVSLPAVGNLGDATATLFAMVPSGTTNPGQFAETTFSGDPQTVSATVHLPSSDFTPYLGTGGYQGTFAATVTDATYSGSASPGLVAFSGSGTVDGTLSVTYTYTQFAVPEPASVALAATPLSLALAAWYSRRQKLARVA